MKTILKEILEGQEVPKEVKERLMKSAKVQLLIKDLAGLFGKNIPKSSADIVETILTKSKKKKT